MRRLRLLLLAAIAVLLTRCTPVEMPAGPAMAPPVLHETALVAPDGMRLPLRVWLPAEGAPRAVIVALHGFNDYSSFFDAPGRWLAERGIASFAYDQRGFGGASNRGVWPGTAALTADLRAAVAAVRQSNRGIPLFLFGESMGGAVIMVAAAAPDAPAVDGIILSAPAVWGRSSMPWYQTTTLWMAVHTLPGSRLSGRGLGIIASDNTEMLRALGGDPQVIKETRIDAVWGLVNLMDEAMAAAPALHGRMLILYGEHDQLIPSAAMREMLAILPDVGTGERRFALYADGYHMLTRDLQAKTVWRDIEAWLDDSRAPLPSGADAYAALRYNLSERAGASDESSTQPRGSCARCDRGHPSPVPTFLAARGGPRKDTIALFR